MVRSRLDALQQSDFLIAQHDGLVAVRMGDDCRGEMVELMTDALDVELRAPRNVGRNAERQHHACNGGMDAASKHEIPKNEARIKVEGFRADASPITYAKHDNSQCRSKQIPKVEVLGIAYCNDDDAAQIVRYGQSCKEYLQTDRTTFAENTQTPQRKRNICCHWNRHSSLHGRVFRTNQKEYYHGDNHASTSSYDRSKGFLYARQLAAKHFSFYLKTNA